MPDLLFDDPPSPPMTEIHVWIGHYENGGEGMLASSLPMPDGQERFMPLMNSQREVAERYGVLAKRIQDASQHGVNRLTRIELRTFRAVTS